MSQIFSLGRASALLTLGHVAGVSSPFPRPRRIGHHLWLLELIACALGLVFEPVGQA